MADDLFEGMDKHFEAANIVDDVVDQSGDNGVQNGTDTSSGGTQTAGAQNDTLQGGNGADSIGSQVDSAKKPGTETKTAGAADTEVKAGDLKLPSGEIVRAGAERRHFENARLFKAENVDLKNQLNTSNQKYGTLETRYNELTQTVKSIGLEDPAQVSSAVRLYKDLARDPVGTATKLLAELKASGHSVDGIGGAVDTAAIQQMLDRRLASTSETSGQQGQQEADKQTASEVQSFITQYPDALIHEQLIAGVIDVQTKRGEKSDLRDVYFKLRKSAIDNGFDWSQPLGPQIQARKSAVGQQQQQQKPMQGGRAVVTAHTEHIDPMKTGGNETKDDIILAAMADAGYKYKR